MQWVDATRHLGSPFFLPNNTASHTLCLPQVSEWHGIFWCECFALHETRPLLIRNATFVSGRLNSLMLSQTLNDCLLSSFFWKRGVRCSRPYTPRLQKVRVQTRPAQPWARGLLSGLHPSRLLRALGLLLYQQHVVRTQPPACTEPCRV